MSYKEEIKEMIKRREFRVNTENGSWRFPNFNAKLLRTLKKDTETKELIYQLMADVFQEGQRQELAWILKHLKPKTTKQDNEFWKICRIDTINFPTNPYLRKLIKTN